MMSDDFEDFIDRIKKYFKLDSDIFDIDFIFVPESDINLNKNPNNKNVKGFKISYHYEPGIDNPEVKVESNVDPKNIHEYLKNVDISKIPRLNDMYKSQFSQEIDANTLSLDTSFKKNEEGDRNNIEPYTEIYDNEGFSEILIEIPGMDEKDVHIKFEERGKRIIFTAENEKHKYIKTILLPFRSSEFEYEMEVNNGIAMIKVSNPIK